MASKSSWRVNDLVAYEEMRESATTLTSLLLASRSSDLSGANRAHHDVAQLRADVLRVNGYDRAAIVALSSQIATDIREIAEPHLPHRQGIDEAARASILQRDILPLYFPTEAASASPTLVIVAGQPGAGRSRAASQLAADSGDDIALLNADDLRAFHSASPEFTRNTAAELSQAIARATAEWTAGCIRYAREAKRSLILEGAFTEPAVVAATAAQFADQGFQTQLVVVGSRRAESLLTVVSHYLRNVQARTPRPDPSREAHDRAFGATRGLVAAVEDAASVDRLSVVNRDRRVVFDAERGDGADAFRGAGAALAAAQSEPMGRFDATQWLSELHHVTEFATSRRDLPHVVAELLVDLHETALREVIPELHVPADGTFATAMEQKTVARLVALRQRIPTVLQPVDIAAPAVAPAGPERGGLSR